MRRDEAAVDVVAATADDDDDDGDHMTHRERLLFQFPRASKHYHGWVGGAVCPPYTD